MRKGTKVLLHNMYIRPFQMLVLFVKSEFWISFVSFFVYVKRKNTANFKKTQRF